MRRLTLCALASATALASAACDSGPLGPNLHVVVANTASGGSSCAGAQDGTVPSLASFARMRITTRVRQGGANVMGGLCDLVVDGTTTLPTLALPTGAAGSVVDFYAEAFAKNADGSFARIGSGALLGVDPTKHKMDELLVRLYAAEGFRCVPGAALKTGRAFHTATTLPNGQILFAGGLTSPAGGIQDEYILTNSVEVYDPTTRQMVAVADDGAADTTMAPVRAFHHAAVVGGSPGGNQFDILLVGGISTTKTSVPALQINAQGAGNTYRLAPILGTASALQPARAEILHYAYDSSTGKATITRDTGVAGALHNAIFQAGAALPGDSGLDSGLAVAGGATYGPGSTGAIVPTGDLHFDVTTDGSTASSGMLSAARIGAGMVAWSDSSGVLVGGITDNMGMAMGPSPAAARLAFSSRPPVATDVMVTGATLAPLFFPTLAVLPDADSGAHQLLVVGGLDPKPCTPLNPCKQPPHDFTPTVLADSGSGDLKATAATSTSGSFACATAGHIKAAVFNAATTIASPDGAHARVLVTGGTAGTGAQGSCTDCEQSDDQVLSCALHQAAIYDAAAGAMDLNAGGMEQLQIARWGHTQSVLPDGMVLVAGGMTRINKQSQSVTDFEIYNPARRDAVTVTNGSAVNDLDDPIYKDIMGTFSREPGKVAHSPSADPAVMPAFACGAPHQ